jgi:hypothetical protein
MDLPEVRAMAELFPIDQIFNNPAYPGILANAFIDAGIPAFTRSTIRTNAIVGKASPLQCLRCH